MKWKTIDRAPKDGTPILVYQPESSLRLEMWGKASWVEHSYYDQELISWGEWEGFYISNPTRWMPLPPPPTTAN